MTPLYNRIAAVLCLLSVVLTSLPAAAASSYSTTVIGPFNRLGRQGMALNNRGHVAGQGAGFGLFLYDGALHQLGKPAGSQWAVGEGISDGDVIAATAQANGVRSAYAVTYPQGHATWTLLRGLSGYNQAQASAILPDGSAITGTLCATGANACSGSKPMIAVVWKRVGNTYGAPTVLPAGKGRFTSSATGIARAGPITVVSGSVSSLAGQSGNSGLWLLPGHSFLTLAGSGRYSGASSFGIAHGSGNTFYVAGEVWRPDIGSVTQGVVWTVQCTASECRQTNRRVLTTFGQVLAVNGKGVAVGYSRPNGDGAGFMFVWQGGKTATLGVMPFAINAAGEIAGVRATPTNTHPKAVLLKPST